MTTKKKKKVVLTKGRKKMAIARARVKEGPRSIKINGTALAVYSTRLARDVVMEPIILAKQTLGDAFDEGLSVEINVDGGGAMGQAYAARTALGKALVEWSGSEELKTLFGDYDRTLLADDSRQKEPKKYLRLGARAKPTKSYR